MTDKEKSEEIASNWWQDLIRKENCNSTEEAIEKACLEMAEYKEQQITNQLRQVILNQKELVHKSSSVAINGSDVYTKFEQGWINALDWIIKTIDKK